MNNQFELYGKIITIKPEYANAFQLYEAGEISKMADYFAHLSTGIDYCDLAELSSEELAQAVESGFKQDVIDLSGSRVWEALLCGDEKELDRLLKFPLNQR